MFVDQRDEPKTHSDVLRAVRNALLAELPSGWAVMMSTDSPPDHADEVAIELWFEGKAVARFPVVFLLAPSRREIARVLDAADDASRRSGLVVSRYLTKPIRDDLRQVGMSYADATGNLWLSRATPLIAIVRDGADADPWRRRGRPSGSLDGVAAARIVRTLVDRVPPITLQDLAESASVSLPTVYRFVDRFVEDLLVVRERRGSIVAVDWRELLVRWSNDAPFAEVNRTRRFLEPRGIGALVRKLREEPGGYAVTGSLAAQPFAPYADPRLAMVYSDDVDQLAQRLGLREVDAGANVVLAEPRSPYVYVGATEVDGLWIVAPSQAVADLMSSPGRGPSEGAELMDWMERNPVVWRHESAD